MRKLDFLFALLIVILVMGIARVGDYVTISSVS